VELELRSELQNKLIDYMTGLEDGISSLVDFGSEQAPILVQEILTYSLIHAVVFASIQLVVCAVCIFVACPVYKLVLEDTQDKVLSLTLSMMSCIPAVVLFCLSISNWLLAVKIYFAPRLFVLGYIRDFIQ
jgi:hypothetical protein